MAICTPVLLSQPGLGYQGFDWYFVELYQRALRLTFYLGFPSGSESAVIGGMAADAEGIDGGSVAIARGLQRG